MKPKEGQIQCIGRDIIDGERNCTVVQNEESIVYIGKLRKFSMWWRHDGR